MADFTKYELEKIKINHKQNNQNNLKARKMSMIRTGIFFVAMCIAVFCFYIFLSKQDNQLEDALKEDIPMSKEWNKD